MRDVATTRTLRNYVLTARRTTNARAYVFVYSSRNFILPPMVELLVNLEFTQTAVDSTNNYKNLCTVYV